MDRHTTTHHHTNPDGAPPSAAEGPAALDARGGPDRVRCRQLLRGDRGSVTAELVLATPLLLLMLLAIVQFATWSHATHIAQAAASQGLAALRTQDGDPPDCAAAARTVLDQLAGGPLTGAEVDCVRDATTATVRVDGAVTPVIPLVNLPVRGDAAGPVERFVPDLTGG
ncbi:TadE/TadG family type IV pilus assembly protein [Pseudonocardia sichuanensis]|uniref:Flp pilus assembly protein TadG n=1 Tax=Pseudonocardia kunmingensis TaxID=630975 RepID=A0A543D9R3_9PSEU|nr:TadE/TadG family type IV pilus assembly protein [Pseudonocardia kunmingensis]TQM06018.1 Flp pilus assembly protein TadG [Pseudonocardia kunmingensis]